MNLQYLIFIFVSIFVIRAKCGSDKRGKNALADLPQTKNGLNLAGFNLGHGLAVRPQGTNGIPLSLAFFKNKKKNPPIVISKNEVYVKQAKGKSTANEDETESSGAAGRAIDVSPNESRVIPEKEYPDPEDTPPNVQTSEKTVSTTSPTTTTTMEPETTTTEPDTTTTEPSTTTTTTMTPEPMAPEGGLGMSGPEEIGFAIDEPESSEEDGDEPESTSEEKRKKRSVDGCEMQFTNCLKRKRRADVNYKTKGIHVRTSSSNATSSLKRFPNGTQTISSESQSSETSESDERIRGRSHRHYGRRRMSSMSGSKESQDADVSISAEKSMSTSKEKKESRFSIGNIRERHGAKKEQIRKAIANYLGINKKAKNKAR